MIFSNSLSWRGWLLIFVTAIGSLAVLLHSPIPQDQSYHIFADQRTVFGIPNAMNVSSNLGFFLVGIFGTALVLVSQPPGLASPLKSAYLTFFVAAALIGIGSAFYHWSPNNFTLLWDRLPMALGFMAFLAIILGEHIELRMGQRLLPFLLLGGIGSVIYWYVTELSGHGDLRPYILVQYLPFLLIPLMLALFPSMFTRAWIIWSMAGIYAVSKVFELFDAPIYAALGVSGHTIKHLVAAAGMLCLILALKVRKPRHFPS